MCKKTNYVNKKYCEECGYKISEVLPSAPLPTVVIDDTKCPKCSKVNQIDAKYCEVCGEQISEKKKVAKEQVPEIVCPSCKGINEKNSKFCGYCRKNLNEIVVQMPVVPEPTKIEIAAGGTKKCPECTFECEARINFCPICNHKF